MQDSLLPKPQADLAAAIKYIQKNKDTFGLQNTEYIINGYSAGGSVVTILGTEQNGWKKYGVSAPKAIFAVYPAISSEFLGEGPMATCLLTTMFGKNFEMDTVHSYDVTKTFTNAYPPCFIIQAQDDPVVSCENAKALKKLCDKHQIPAQLELPEHGAHGWGDGRGTDAEGWIDRAVRFVEDLK